MSIHEFEIRFMAYEGMNKFLQLWLSESDILNAASISSRGQLTNKLTETLPEELKKITLDTYTPFKFDLIKRVGAKKIWNFTVADYIERLEYECKVIKEMGFNEYLLIVQDFINRAKDHKIAVWPGRWSAAGSLLTWFIGITDVDPLLYGLLFERFLNPARISMPDVDIDFEDTQRERVVEYVKHKYGEDKVAYIGTYMKMASKAAFKDVARALGMPFEKANLISNLIPMKATLQTLMSHEETPEELKNFYESDELVKKTLDMATILEGNIRQVWVHACGMIISPKPLTEFASVQYPVKIDKNQTSQPIVTQLDGKNLEKIWLLKMDFLGLRNLSIIKNCIKIVKARYEKNNEQLPEIFSRYLDTMWFYPPLDDERTYKKVLQQWDTSGVFQFEWDGIRNFLMKLKPTDINDIIAMGALYRPGPMEFIPNYIRRKHWEEDINYMLPEIYDEVVRLYGEETAEEEKRKLIEDLSPFCDVTFWIVVYQEQLMFMVQKMAGFSLAEADNLRRGVWKKIKEVIEKIKGEFIEKAATFRNYKPETSRYVYEKMVEPAAFYSFNKSHSVAYGLISYQTAYLKAHFPIEFHAALLRSVEDDTDKMSKFIDEIKQHWLPIFAPDVNESFNHIAAINDYIRLGFVCVKWVGTEVWEFIEQERKNGGVFTDLENFLRRCEKVINKKSLESLTKAGALDNFIDRNQILHNVQSVLDRVKHSGGQSDGLFWAMMPNRLELKKVDLVTKMEKLLYEYEVFKTFVSAHPFDGLYHYLKKFNFLSTVKEKENFWAYRMLCYIKNIQRAKKKWFFVQVEDISDQHELFFKDVLDFQKFDILVIYGFKARNFRVQKIVKVTLDQLIADAQKVGKYNPDETVVKVKEARRQASGDQQPAESAPIIDEEHFAEETLLDEEKNESVAVYQNDETDESLQTVFQLPSDMVTLQKMMKILKEYRGENEITLWEKKYLISDEWKELLQELLAWWV